MEDFSPSGVGAGSSIVRQSADATGSGATAFRTSHWSEPSASWEVVGTGKGARFEQPGPEHGVGRFGPFSPRGS